MNTSLHEYQGEIRLAEVRLKSRHMVALIGLAALWGASFPFMG